MPKISSTAGAVPYVGLLSLMLMFVLVAARFVQVLVGNLQNRAVTAKSERLSRARSMRRECREVTGALPVPRALYGRAGKAIKMGGIA